MRRSPLVALAAASALGAKRASRSRPPTCDWKPTDAWVKRQAEFFDDSKHDWSDDTLRTALLQAAGLTAPLDGAGATRRAGRGQGPAARRRRRRR